MKQSDIPAVPGVYLIHMQGKVGGRSSHYIGGSGDIAKRIRSHKRGSRARFIQAAKEQGIRWEVVRVWAVSSAKYVWPLERQLKRWAGHKRLCPICSGDDAWKRGMYNELRTASMMERG